MPVHIQPSFLFVTLVLNLGLAGADPGRFVLWTLIVLGSVLVHELGHAIACLAFGLRPRIDLHGFGGTTSWAAVAHPADGPAGAAGPALPITPARGIVISLAGPAMGFAAGAVVAACAAAVGPGLWLVPRALGSPFGLAPPPPQTSIAEFVYGQLLFVNVGWGLLNLLPMLPLDGGNVMTQTFALAGRSERPARFVSLIVASSATLVALATGRLFCAMLAGSFVATNWQAVQALNARAHDQPMAADLERARAALHAGDAPSAIALSRPIALGARTAPLRAEALQLLASAFLLEGRVADADAAIAAMPRGYSATTSYLELRSRAGAPTPTGRMPASEP